MKRALVSTVALVVACSLLAVGAFATTAGAQEESSTEIDSCTVIDEPGEYEFVADVEADQQDSCIEIRADSVSIDGNGHALRGPGPDENGTAIDLHSDGDSRDLEVRNLEISGWEYGVYAGGNYEMTDSVVRNNDHGLHHTQGGADDLTNVTIEDNRVGINSMMGGATGSDVTIRDNEKGIFGMDSGNYDLEDSRIVDNEGYGAKIEHGSTLNLTDSTVSGNGGHGIYFPYPGYPVDGHLVNTTVSDNGGDGIRTASDPLGTIRLVDVAVENNDGIEVNAAPDEEHFESEETTSSISADGLAVGPSATTAFEEEAIRLEPVDQESLPDREDGTAAGDGLNVSGNVSGPVDLELDVDTDDETVDLWRYDGSDWDTVEEDLTVSEGTVETSVDRNGTYAPGTAADDSGGTGDDSDGSDDTGDDSDSSDDTGDDSDSSDDTDGSQDDSEDGSDSSDGEDQTPTPADEDDGSTTPTQTPADEDDETDTPTSTPSDSDGEKKEKTDTPTDSSGPSDCGCPAADDEDTGEGDGSTPTDETTASPEDHQQADETDDETDETDAQAEDADDGESLADGPGLGPLAALAALLGSVLLLRRRG